MSEALKLADRLHALHASCSTSAYSVCDVAADVIREQQAEIERLRGLIRDVIAGDWCITNLQESIGELEGDNG
jgi:hypothetical protein